MSILEKGKFILGFVLVALLIIYAFLFLIGNSINTVNSNGPIEAFLFLIVYYIGLFIAAFWPITLLSVVAVTFLVIFSIL